MRPLVIGFGNTLRRDDGVGVAVAEGVRARAGDRVDVITAFQLLPEHAESIAGADRVVLVDAHAGDAPGTVRSAVIDETSAPAAELHGPTAKSLLRLARELFGASPPTFLVTVGAASFEFGEGLSPAAAAAVPDAVEEVLRRLEGGAEPG